MKRSTFFSLIVSIVLFVATEANAGHSSSFRKQDDHGNYGFGYDIKNGHGATNGRKESGGPHGVVGSYYITDVDGRHRTVHYVADKAGFRVQIKTNEPGTKSSHPAAAAYSSAYGPTAPSGGYGYHDLHGVAHVSAPVYGPASYGHSAVGHNAPHHQHHHHYALGGGQYYSQHHPSSAPVGHYNHVNHFAGPHGASFYA